VNIIPEHSRVLDLGCGDGVLLQRLVNEKHVRGQGVELSNEGVKSCIEKGLTVFQGNLNEGLEGFSKNSFDFVILNYTLKFLKRPKFVIEEMLKIGNKVIIGMQNSAYLSNRVRYLLFGKKNSRFENLLSVLQVEISISQFLTFCRKLQLNIVRKCYLNGKVKIPTRLFPNLIAESAVFIIQS
jgi:methionine biosynthesis protein MetW